MKKLIVPLCVAVCAGCLSVGRIPFPHHEKYSDDGVCTNREWPVDWTPVDEIRTNGVYMLEAR